MTRDELADLAESFDLSEADLEDLADRAANQVLGFVALWQERGDDEQASMRSLRRMARGYAVELPALAALPQLLNRLTAPTWWRRALRKRYRVVERHEIARGAVHDHASPYVSAKALRRHRRDRKRLAELLAALEAINLDTGEALPLDELAKTSQANPLMRRMAMMARIRGIADDAKAKGEQAAMLTITAPSRMHARHRGGRRNDRHDGSCPRQAQAYLNRVWRRALRELQHRGLALRGLRTVEPHHDGCPHWHVLVFAATDALEPALQVLRAHALADSPDEPGAAQHRFDVERIDEAKGCAVAYVAKYVSKSIDGHALDVDDETGESGPDAAERIVAWSRRWGIRQFQFFGLPAITPMRELYRLGDAALGSQALDAARQACRAKDHAGYLRTIQAHGLRLHVAYEARPSSRYAGEITHAIYGLTASGADLQPPKVITTRTENWCIQPRPATRTPAADAFPWTRFNNCATPSTSSTYAHDEAGLHAGPMTQAREGRRRRPNKSRQAALAAA